ncbi:uncharacterized protein METZ01_LOCUS183664 [marine metagenome]|uniref:Uncharacterized protein n=1 Tax=marine metagenome TaxID=408172 RepID=A0A382CXC0_9ZZZZ
MPLVNVVTTIINQDVLNTVQKCILAFISDNNYGRRLRRQIIHYPSPFVFCTVGYITSQG